MEECTENFTNSMENQNSLVKQVMCVCVCEQEEQIERQIYLKMRMFNITVR